MVRKSIDDTDLGNVNFTVFWGGRQFAAFTKD